MIYAATGIKEMDTALKYQVGAEVVFYPEALLETCAEEDIVVISPRLTEEDITEVIRQLRRKDVRIILLYGKDINLAKKCVSYQVYDLLGDPVADKDVVDHIYNPAKFSNVPEHLLPDSVDARPQEEPPEKEEKSFFRVPLKLSERPMRTEPEAESKSEKEQPTVLEFFRESVPDRPAQHTALQNDRDVAFLVNRVRSVSKQAVISVNQRTAALTSCRGGVGASALTAALALETVRNSSLSAVVVDCDARCDYGQVSRYYGLTGERKAAIRHTLASWKLFPFEQKALEEVVFNHLYRVERNLYLLPAIKSVSEIQFLVPELAAEVVDVLARHFDLVLVDAGSYLDDISIAAMERADEVFIVTTLYEPDTDMLRDYLAYTFPFGRIPKQKTSLLFNRVGKNGKAHAVARGVGLPFTAVIPESPEFFTSVTKSCRIPDLPEDHPFPRELGKVLKRLFPQQVLTNEKGGFWQSCRSALNKFRNRERR